MAANLPAKEPSRLQGSLKFRVSSSLGRDLHHEGGAGDALRSAVWVQCIVLITLEGDRQVISPIITDLHHHKTYNCQTVTNGGEREKYQEPVRGHLGEE